jgi:hypothetical protein
MECEKIELDPQCFPDRVQHWSQHSGRAALRYNGALDAATMRASDCDDC